LTFKSSLARVEDATRHVEEVKRLYLSTVETLATAIDAKDQVTHGHIRRVQHLALALARELGVRDTNQLQALEASALLHDTGKLAIPEHILNKPGKLTRGEFDKMKEHASVGADILSSIQFPYPVVPIVRHHHESWDGSGYPDGLKGIEIPVGARILAVVDCYDALTSDRPYRPRMSNEDAIAILIQRRGTMYDPLVVDTFIANIDRLATQVAVTDPPAAAPGSRRRVATTSQTQLGNSRANSTEVQSLLETVVRAANAKLGVVFAADRDSDTLVSIACRTAAGPSDDLISMPVGFGVAGWVAANGQSVLNADPALDFGQQKPLGGLVRTICVPIRIRDDISGAISLYTDDPRGFNEEDRHSLEQTAKTFQVEATANSFNGMLREKRSVIASASTVH
jgi:putative nucleotidyltransferase with HDIG domain